MIQDREKFIERILILLEKKDYQTISKILSQYQPADIAEVLKNLEATYRGMVFKLIDKATAALVLIMLDETVISSLFETLGPRYISEILNEMPSDDAADLLGSLPKELSGTLLGLMQDEDADEVQELLGYDVKSAGGIMTTEYVAIRKDITAGRAIEVLRETAPDAETVYYVYVVDMGNKLVGVISLRELIVSNPNTLIEEIMHKKVISVSVDMDQEEVAELVSRYDFLAVPVVDKDSSLVGIITVDDIIDVIHEEASEDIFRLSGTQAKEDGTEFEDIYSSIKVNIRLRMPWLIITMLGGLLAGRILKGIEAEMSTVVALAFFIPILTGMGGNIGTQ